MSLTTLVIAGAAFAAGVVVGVVLREQDVLTIEDLKRGTRKIVVCIKDLQYRNQDSVTVQPLETISERNNVKNS